MAKSRMQIQMELKSKQKGSRNKNKKKLSSSEPEQASKRNSGSRNQAKATKDIRGRQYSLGTESSVSNVHYYKFTGKQTKSWKPIGKQLQDYLYHVIDSGVKMVGSKRQFSNNEDVQNLLNELKLQLKAKLHTIKVPSKRHGDYNKLKVKTDDLKEELESLTQQQLHLEKAIREEERSIEEMEELKDTRGCTKLILKIPEGKLGLPKLAE